MKPDPLPTRLKAGAPGLGQPNETDIERRAAELAQSDGRDAFTDADLARAAEELSGGTPHSPAPETDANLEELTAWDEPPGQSGGVVEATPLEDEGEVAGDLIGEGIEEADHDTRVEAEEHADEES